MNKYKYAMKLRPPGPGCQPMEGLIAISTEESDIGGMHSWGKALYSRELTEEETEHYDMEWIGTYIDGK